MLYVEYCTYSKTLHSRSLANCALHSSQLVVCAVQSVPAYLVNHRKEAIPAHLIQRTDLFNMHSTQRNLPLNVVPYHP